MILVLVLTLLSIRCSASAQTAQPALSREMAIQTAREFCKRIGAPLEGNLSADFPSDTEIDWRQRWKVTFPGVSLEIVDGSGVVCDYYDSRVGHRLDVYNEPEGQAISEDEAIRRASDALAATGPHAELALSGTALEQIASPAKAASHVWRVWWNRQFAGVPYSLPDGARVSLNAGCAPFVFASSHDASRAAK